MKRLVLGLSILTIFTIAGCAEKENIIGDYTCQVAKGSLVVTLSKNGIGNLQIGNMNMNAKWINTENSINVTFVEPDGDKKTISLFKNKGNYTLGLGDNETYPCTKL